MRSKIIFVVLFMLSFTVFHDSFMPLLEKNKHTNSVHYMSNTTPTHECADINEIHSMLHFMAIITLYKNTQMQFAKREMIPHLLTRYSPPLKKTSYKPPTA